MIHKQENEFDTQTGFFILSPFILNSTKKLHFISFDFHRLWEKVRLGMEKRVQFFFFAFAFAVAKERKEIDFDV